MWRPQCRKRRCNHSKSDGLRGLPGARDGGWIDRSRSCCRRFGRNDEENQRVLSELKAIAAKSLTVKVDFGFSFRPG
jgi:hypothetical protein